MLKASTELTDVVSDAHSELIRHVEIVEGDSFVKLRHGPVGDRKMLAGVSDCHERETDARLVILVHESHAVTGQHFDALRALQVDLMRKWRTSQRMISPWYRL